MLFFLKTIKKSIQKLIVNELVPSIFFTSIHRSVFLSQSFPTAFPVRPSPDTLTPPASARVRHSLPTR